LLNHLDHIRRTIPITPRPGECGSRNHPDDRLCERCTDVIFDNSLSATTTGYSPFLSSPPTSTTMDPGAVAYVANVAVVTKATVAERAEVAETDHRILRFTPHLFRGKPSLFISSVPAGSPFKRACPSCRHELFCPEISARGVPAPHANLLAGSHVPRTKCLDTTRGFPSDITSPQRSVASSTLTSFP